MKTKSRVFWGFRSFWVLGVLGHTLCSYFNQDKTHTCITSTPHPSSNFSTIWCRRLRGASKGGAVGVVDYSEEKYGFLENPEEKYGFWFFGF